MLIFQMECKDSRVGAVEEVSPQCCQEKTATIRVWIAPMCDSCLQREAVWQL